MSGPHKSGPHKTRQTPRPRQGNAGRAGADGGRPLRKAQPPGRNGRGRGPARARPLALQVLQAAGRAGTQAVLNFAFANGLYRATLRGPLPDAIVLSPPEYRPAMPELGARIAAGRFDLAGGHLTAGAASPFALPAPSDEFAEALHDFGWLRHLAAAGDADGAAIARGHVADWLELCGRWHKVGWRPHVIARRLTAWASHAHLLLSGGDVIFRSAVLRAMAAQARHLRRTAPLAPDGLPRLEAAAGLALSGLTLAEGRTRLSRGLALLERELARQLLPDGGHISRNPQAQLDLLRVLVTLRNALVARDVEVPAALRNAIDRAMPMLRFFRHGDGRLALFNGAGEGAAATIEAVLAQDDTKGRPFGFAPHSGYQRLSAGRTLVIADAGRPPPPEHAHKAHAGCLAFEMSAGRHRLVVNCGPASGRGPEWEIASRATAAHSTLVVADTSSARLLRAPWLRRLLGPRLLGGPRRVESQRNEGAGGLWVDMRHDGYAPAFGLEHRRRLYLSADGDDLRGEDTLIRIQPPRPAWWDPLGLLTARRDEEDFVIRFHLHPDVRASLAQDGSNVLALLPNGDGWQMRISANAELGLEESIYLGRDGAPRRTRQIVVTHHVFRGEAHVKWSFRRLSTRTGARDDAAAQADAFAGSADDAGEVAETQPPADGSA